MNKKLISFVTAVTMMAGMCVAPAMTASAADNPGQLKDAIMTKFDSLAVNGELVIDEKVFVKDTTDPNNPFIKITVDNSGTRYDSIDTMLLNSNVVVDDIYNHSYIKTTKSETDFDVKVVLDMAEVGKAYSEYITLAENLISLAALDGTTINPQALEDANVISEFTVNVAIPDGLTFKNNDFNAPAFSLEGNAITFADVFQEISRDYTNNVLSLTIQSNKMKKQLDSYFNGENTPDIILEGTLTAPAPTSTSGTTYTIKGNMTGKSEIYSNLSDLKIGHVEYTAIQDTATGEEDEVDTNQQPPIVYVSDTATFKKTSGGTPPSGGGTTQYTVKFESNGGSAVSPQTVNRNNKATKPTDPTYEGHKFEGWYTDKELTTLYDFNTPVTKNITLYAKWSEVTEPTPTPTPTPTPVAPSHPVPDDLNGEDHFAYIVGYPEGDVRPTNNITRAEVATIFFRLLKDEVRDTNLTQENTFLDVNEGDWYNAAISTLSKLGILNGRTDDEFEPNSFITRAEFATIAARFDDSEYGISDNFSDVTDHWAEEYIHEAADYGWINGYEDGTFRPDKLIVRAEAMTIINRVLQRVPENTDDLLDDMVKWADNMDTSKWYYIAVQEATNSHDYNRKESNFETWTKITAPRDWTTYEK